MPAHPPTQVDGHDHMTLTQWWLLDVAVRHFGNNLRAARTVVRAGTELWLDAKGKGLRFAKLQAVKGTLHARGEALVYAGGKDFVGLFGDLWQYVVKK